MKECDNSIFISATGSSRMSLFKFWKIQYFKLVKLVALEVESLLSILERQNGSSNNFTSILECLLVRKNTPFKTNSTWYYQS